MRNSFLAYLGCKKNIYSATRKFSGGGSISRKPLVLVHQFER